MDTLQELFNIARVRAPLAKGVGGTGAGEVILAVTATNSVFKVPDWMQGKACYFKANGANVEFIFAGKTVATAQTLVYGQVTAVDATTKVMTVNAATGRRINDGEAQPVRVPTPGDLGFIKDDGLYMSAIASTTGTLHIFLASESVVGQTKG